jgi:hypothetical protein
MAPRSSVSVRIVNNRFAEIARGLAPLADEITEETLLRALATAQQIVPIRTGALRASLSIRKESAGSGILYSYLDYAPWVEYGTTKMAAQPYLIPALEAARPWFMAQMRDLESRME